ncbi:type II secretion system protein [Candidatus Saccharibacteria bacterium]|nr:type II secretion system protein [Candidatus Saccharibacteria bacterium]
MNRSTQKAGKRGFTIVELTVVIFVIGILATMAIVVSSSVQKQNRDAKRESDVLLIKRAVDNHYRQHGEHPAPNDATFFSQFSSKNMNDPFDDTTRTLFRIPETGYCSHSYYGTGEARNRTSCKNYSYISYKSANGTGSTLYSHGGGPSTGCQFRVNRTYQISQNPQVWSWYLLSRYDEQSNTMKFYGDPNKVSVTKYQDSTSFPNQVCKLEAI